MAESEGPQERPHAASEGLGSGPQHEATQGLGDGTQGLSGFWCMFVRHAGQGPPGHPDWGRDWKISTISPDRPSLVAAGALQSAFQPQYEHKILPVEGSVTWGQEMLGD